MDIIPIKTNYYIEKYYLDFIFLWTTSDCPHSIKNKPFMKSQIHISDHLRYFGANYEGRMGYY